jgi:putative hydrolase of the HAD superfamily
VLTEGSLARAQATAAALAIDSYLERIVEVKKERPTLVRMHKALGAPVHVFMVGDQLERDIRPARQAGFTTVFFPGAFRPRWEDTSEDVVPDYVIDTFADVPRIVFGGRP